MGTLLNYLEKYGKYTFQEMPMTDVDSLALCQLAYLKFDGMVPGAEDGMPGVPGREADYMSERGHLKWGHLEHLERRRSK